MTRPPIYANHFTKPNFHIILLQNIIPKLWLYCTNLMNSKITSESLRLVQINNECIHMVRNHQDGYPYLNLSLFFVKSPAHWGPEFIDQSVLPIKFTFLYIFFLKVKSFSETLLFSSVLHFFVVVENIQNHQFCWKN